MTKSKQTTLYRYSYHNKAFKMETFEYCYEQQTGEYIYYLVYADDTEIDCVEDWDLNNMNSDYEMWSLSPDMKEFYLKVVKHNKLDMLRKAMSKVNKLKHEISYIEEELLTCD